MADAYSEQQEPYFNIRHRMRPTGTAEEAYIFPSEGSEHNSVIATNQSAASSPDMLNHAPVLMFDRNSPPSGPSSFVEHPQGSPSNSSEYSPPRILSNNSVTSIVSDVADSQHYVHSDHFECSLCYRLFYLPVTTKCGHTYCKSCIESSLTFSSNCPICRRKLCDTPGEFDCAVSYVLVSILEKSFPEEYAERASEEPEMPTSPPTSPAVPRSAPIQTAAPPANTSNRRRASWWAECLGSASILLYPCDM